MCIRYKLLQCCVLVDAALTLLFQIKDESVPHLLEANMKLKYCCKETNGSRHFFFQDAS